MSASKSSSSNSSETAARGARVLSRARQSLSPFVGVEAVTAIVPGSQEPQLFHALTQSDYVQILCLHVCGKLVVVRQYRPVVDRWTTELPGGLRDAPEEPQATARREVEEETGLTVRTLVPILESFADVGRLANRLYGYFAIVDGELSSGEVGVEPGLVSGAGMRDMALEGGLAVPGHIALLYLAACHEKVRALCAELGFGAPPWLPAGAVSE